MRSRVAAGLPAVLARVPEPVGRGFCVAVGRAAHLLVGRDRRLARANLARVHPELPETMVRRRARRVFEEIGRNAYDFLRYPRLSPTDRASLVTLEGEEHLGAALAPGRGALLVTGHLGNWEVMAAHLSAAGYPLRSLARPLREARLESRLRNHREAMGVRTLSARDDTLAAARHLRRGGLLGVLIDQRVRAGGVTVPFLGQPTRMVDGPARLALATGARVVPGSVHREADHRHRIVLDPPLDPDPGAADPVTDLTARLAAALEQRILEHPDQWMWIHPRWEPVPEERP